MSHMKYIKTQKKRKVRKEQQRSAIFPDGDADTDASSRSTFHDLCGNSSNSTYSERSSIDSGNLQKLSLESRHEEIIHAFTNLDMTNTNQYDISNISKGFGTKLSTIDIQITSPEHERSVAIDRPSCRTMIRQEIEPESSSDDHTKKQELEEMMENEQMRIRNNDYKNIKHMQLPSIDVISPSPTLSVFSDRQILTDQQFDSLLRPSFSRISGRTLTPLSSLSSSSTMSDSFSLTSGSEDGLLGMRKRDLPRKQVLPPIRKSSFAEQRPETTAVTSGKKVKSDLRFRKTKTKSQSENRTSSCSSEDSVVKSSRPDVRKSGGSVSEKMGAAALRRETRVLKSKQADFSRISSEPINKSISLQKKELARQMSKEKLLLKRDARQSEDMCDRKEDNKIHFSPKTFGRFRTEVTFNRSTFPGAKNKKGPLKSAKTTPKRQREDKGRINVNDKESKKICSIRNGDLNRNSSSDNLMSPILHVAESSYF